MTRVEGADVAYLIRVRLPDRPGSLGSLAVALGSVDADILGVDVVERGSGGAVDDLVVELPTGGQPEKLLVAASRVAGARVLSVQPYPLGLDIHRELALVEDVAADPARALDLLVGHAPELFRSGWAVALGPGSGGPPTVIAVSPAGPGDLAMAARPALPWYPPEKPVRLDPEATWIPASWQRMATDLAAAPVGRGGRALLLGRPGGPEFLDSEVMRLGHLASIVGMVDGATEHL